MKRRTVGRDFTKRTEIDLERPDGSLRTLGDRHWSTDTDPLSMAVEATAWLRSRGLPDLPSADCSLSHHLRSYHGVRPDSPEDLAGKIIDDVVCLEAIGSGPRSIPVAVELGKLHVLFSIYRQLDDTRQKTRKTKRRAWAVALADSLAGTSTNDEAWEAIPDPLETDDEPNIETGGRGYIVYRDGDSLCAKDDRTGAVESITRKTFFRHYFRKPDS